MGKIISWVKSNLIVVGICVLILIIIAVIGVVVSSNGNSNDTKKNDSYSDTDIEGIINDFVSETSNGNAKKALKLYDARGAIAWNESDGDVEEFLELYNDIDKDDIEMAEESIKDEIDYMERSYEEYSYEVKDIRNIKEVKGCKNLYKATVKIESMKVYDDGEESTSTTNSNFVIYKGKIIQFD